MLINTQLKLAVLLFIGLLVVLLIAFWPWVAQAIVSDERGFLVEPGGTDGRLLEADPERRFIDPPPPPKPHLESIQVRKTMNAPSVPSGAVQRLVEAEFGKGHIMYWVALNESGFDPMAASGTGPKGVFQIANQTWAGYKCTGNVYNASDNIKCARKIYDANGLTDWRWSKWEGFDGGWGKRL